jgi:hypothetical protein
MPGHSSWILGDFQAAFDSKRYSIIDNRHPHYLVKRVELVENPSVLKCLSNKEKSENKQESRRRNYNLEVGVSSNGKEELFVKFCIQSWNFLPSRFNKQAVSAFSDGTGTGPRKRNGIQSTETK